MFSKLLPKNESGLDRVVRIVVGVLLLSLVFAGPRTAWGFIGLLPLLTGLTGSCPLYQALGIGTYQPHEAGSR